MDGWSQSESNFSIEYPRSYVQPFSGGVTGFSVGGFYDTEPFTGGNRLAVSRSIGGHGARGAFLEVAFPDGSHHPLDYAPKSYEIQQSNSNS